MDAVCHSFKLECLQGIHGPQDTYQLALYMRQLDASMNAYSPEGEAKGQGYLAGGQVLNGYRVAMVDGVAQLSFEGVTWRDSTLSAVACLIYNATKGGRAVSVHDFGGQKMSKNAAFTVELPAPVVTLA